MLHNRILKSLIFLIGIIISLYTILYFVREGTKVVRYLHSGILLTNARSTEDSLLVISNVDTSEFTTPVYPSRGDTIVSIADSIVNLNIWNEYFNTPAEPGRVISFKYVHQGDTLEGVVETHLPYLSDSIPAIGLQIIRFLLNVSFISVGLWAFFKRSDSGGVRALTMFCFAMASFMLLSVRILSSAYAAFEIPLNNIFTNIFNNLTPFFGGFWLNLQLLFPRPKRFIIKRPVFAYSLCYAPLAVLIILDAVNIIAVSTAALIVISIQIFAGFFILGYSYDRAENNLEKRQTRLVLIGSGIGLGNLFLLLMIAVLFPVWFDSWQWNVVLVILCFLGMILSPLSFAYAFQRYRLLEVEGKLRRGTRYILVTAVLLALFVATVYLIGEILLRNLGISTRTPTIIIAVTLAIGFTPALRRIQGVLEHRFYPERFKLREMSHNFLKNVISIPDRNSLWRTVENQLYETAGIEAVFPIIRARDNRAYFLEKGARENTPIYFPPDMEDKITSARWPIVVDEAIASERHELSEETGEWLKRKKIALLLPMIIQSRLMGFLGLGFKVEKEDYSPEELLILSSLASQLALASENIRLLEENIEKQRMEEELRMARSIQQGFLPHIIPHTEGLTISARSKFCLEVAGDYYDVITLPSGETVLAVGDVSGKGAGAALLMANLQASLRTAIGSTIMLNEVVARINNLIYSNTPPEQYITFFVSIYNPLDNTLTYVNAGHNPPVVVRHDCSIEELNEGGLILGFLPVVEYELGSIKLETGDLVLMYTDGVSEAMNDKEEEYGEKRLINHINECRDLGVDEILNKLECSIQDFIGDIPLQDDFTIILAKIE
ncbi:MAG: SpoIIE family protein phosphatase [FCB group bacterium]|nr:SpoIIE family protein phosphatase [FCB group bacterium]